MGVVSDDRKAEGGGRDDGSDIGVLVVAPEPLSALSYPYRPIFSHFVNRRSSRQKKKHTYGKDIEMEDISQQRGHFPSSYFK